MEIGSTRLIRLIATGGDQPDVGVLVEDFQRQLFFLTTGEMHAAGELLPLFDLDVGRAVDRGDLFAALLKFGGQRVLQLGAVDKRVPAPDP